MDISILGILGYKLNVEILILISVVYLILVSHTLWGCCNCSLSEAFSLMESFTNAIDISGNSFHDISGNSFHDISGNMPTPAGAIVAHKIKGSVQSKEGFVGANTNFGESSVYDLNSQSIIDTSSWSATDMNVTSGKPLNSAVKKFLDREPQPIPLPEGELSMFARTPFKHECCPNTYSTSTGCACMTGQQYNYLIMRGGNNVPYSEY